MPLPLVQPPVRDRVARHIDRPHHVVGAPPVLAFWHLASFDAPSVAVAWSLGFAWARNAHLAWQVPFLLALTTWWMYVCDRLLDARAGIHLPTSTALFERHYFHWRYRRTFVPLAVIAACAAAVVALVSMPLIVIERGIALLVCSMAYFSVVHVLHQPPQPKIAFSARLISKEFFVGLIFTSGCTLPYWPQLQPFTPSETSAWLFWIPAIYFAALAWLNCWCIAKWESANAGVAPTRFRADGSQAARPTIFLAAAMLALLGLALAAVAPESHQRPAALLAAGAISALLLALLDHLRDRITPLTLRAAADLVMLTPLVLILR